MKRLVVSAALILFAGAAPALAAGDVEAGKAVFKKCVACHAVEPGKNKIGPSLFGVVGRASASVEGFNYSTAMKATNKTWDDPTLHQYLEAPAKMVPGTKMAFPGLKEEKDRDDVIAYLATLK
jgi:cytochrome c2